MIVHLRVVPGFRIAAEERRRPELRSHPVVIGGLPHQRGAVCEASFAAQRCGVRAGMPLSQAQHHCPDGIFLTPDLPYYERLWGMVCDVLRRSTPLVEPLELGQAVCELSGCERHWSDPVTMAQAIAAQLWTSTALAPWLGVASNRLVAQLASTIVGADGIAVVDPGRERAFLAELPITLLPDVDARLALTFQVLGLRTIGQFAALPLSAVKQRFGAAGEKLYRYARGLDERPVLPPPPRPSVAARHECEDGSLQEAIEAIHRLAEECAAELERRRLAGRLVTLTLEWAGTLSPSALTPGPSPVRRRGEAIPGAWPQRERGEAIPGGCCTGIETVDSLPVPGRTVAARAGSAARAPLPPDEKEPEGKEIFPIPYRIHSMLPQPGSGVGFVDDPRTEVDDAASGRRDCTSVSVRLPQPRSRSSVGSPPPGLTGTEPQSLPVASEEVVTPPPASALATKEETLDLSRRVSVVVRTPVRTAPALLERGQSLLLQHWPRSPEAAQRRLQAIELEIAEFEAPAQCSFAELSLLSQSGRLSGLSADRLQKLVEQEQALTARYGDAPFLHVTQLDPANALAERRFRWTAGLPWTRDDTGRGSRAPRRGRRRP